MQTRFMPETTHLRPASLSDARAIGDLHVAVWRETYAGIAPKALQDVIETRRGPAHWQDTLAKIVAEADPRAGVLVADTDAQGIVGFTQYGPSSDPALGSGGEVKHLFVVRAFRSQGLGARLLHAAFDKLRAAGFAQAHLAVVIQNQRAIDFYLREGARKGARFRDAGPLWRSENIALAWRL